MGMEASRSLFFSFSGILLNKIGNFYQICKKCCIKENEKNELFRN